MDTSLPAGTALFLALVFVFAAGCTGTPQDTGSPEGFDDFITAKMADYEVPGAVAGIVRNDSVNSLKGFGVRENGKPEHGYPYDPHELVTFPSGPSGTVTGFSSDGAGWFARA